MPGKRPRQIQRTTSMLQLGGTGTAMGARFSQTAPGTFRGEAGAPYSVLTASLKQELLETMEVCTGSEEAVTSGVVMEDNLNGMAIDDGVEESLYASHVVRSRVLYKANDTGIQITSMHPASLPRHSPNKAMAPQTSVIYRSDEASRSAQPGHFLDACNLCLKRLGQGRDVFIYRGDRAFCSVECRHSQIVADEMRENRGMVAAKDGVASSTQARNPPSTKADEMRENCGMAAAKDGVASNTQARDPPSTKQVETAAAA